MTAIYDLRRGRSYNKWKKYKGQFGVEFETETAKEYQIPEMKHWRVVNDGSLRNFGQEYILRLPMDGKALEDAFDEFDNLKFKFLEDQVSCSSHLHVNMMNETALTLVNFLCVYCLIEPILIDVSGEDRISNLFCLSLVDAEMNFQNIQRFLNNIVDNRLHLPEGCSQDYAKYGALNLAAFQRFGSLELRTFKGITETSEFRDYVGLIEEMLVFCRQDMTPNEHLEAFLSNEDNFIRSVFPSIRDYGYSSFDALVSKHRWFFVSACTNCDWGGVRNLKGVQKLEVNDFTISQAMLHLGYGGVFPNLSAAQQRDVLNFIGQFDTENPMPEYNPPAPRPSPHNLNSFTINESVNETSGAREARYVLESIRGNETNTVILDEGEDF